MIKPSGATILAAAAGAVPHPVLALVTAGSNVEAWVRLAAVILAVVLHFLRSRREQRTRRGKPRNPAD